MRAAGRRVATEMGFAVEALSGRCAVVERPVPNPTCSLVAENAAGAALMQREAAIWPCAESRWPMTGHVRGSQRRPAAGRDLGGHGHVATSRRRPGKPRIRGPARQRHWESWSGSPGQGGGGVMRGGLAGACGRPSRLCAA